MTRKIFFVFLIIQSLNVFELLACSCKWFDSFEEKEDLFNSSDFVIIAKPVKNANPNRRIGKKGKIETDSIIMGYDVLIKIIKVFKGKINLDTFLIIQDESNCSGILSTKDSILIFADKVNIIKESIKNKEGFHEKSGYEEENHSFYIWDSWGYYKSVKTLKKKYLTGFANNCSMFDLSDTTHFRTKKWIQYISTKKSL